VLVPATCHSAAQKAGWQAPQGMASVGLASDRRPA
jgi:hypothetical protein